MTQNRLIAHWLLDGDTRDSLSRHHGRGKRLRWTRGLRGVARSAALFNGRDSLIEIADAPGLQLGGHDFSISAWIKCAKPMRGAFGGVLSKFDAPLRCGLNLWVSGGSAGYSSLSDARHVHAGIDDGFAGEWTDHGRPENPGSNNPLVSTLTVHRGALYAGVTDAAKPAEACKVFRWAGATKWIDCGRVGDDLACPSVMSMIVHDGALYAGTGSWDWGRAEDLRKAGPPHRISRVFRYEGGKQWRDLNLPAAAQRVLCLASFKGELYAGLDRGASGRCFKLNGTRWIDCGTLDDRDNFECLMPVGGVLYGASHFAVYRYEGGRKWACIGRRPFGISQIHSFQAYAGTLWVGTWPQGYVLRYEGGKKWSNTGRLGLATDRPGVAPINEINALGVHNGKLYAGVLPKAQIYRYEADGQWTLLGSFASRRDWDAANCPSWMRVLTLTTHKGDLFACTGTSQARTRDLDPDRTAGRVLSCQAGLTASHEHDLGGEWTHVAMVRAAGDLRLYINGKLSHRASAPRGQHFHLGNAEPLRIGAGPQGCFDGAISDVRLYGEALAAPQVRSLWKR